jgi:hypothetical protein
VTKTQLNFVDLADPNLLSRLINDGTYWKLDNLADQAYTWGEQSEYDETIISFGGDGNWEDGDDK